MAMAPPRGLNFAMSGRNSRAHIRGMAANASLHSMASKSSMVIPERASSFRVTGLGALRTRTGSSAPTAKALKRARGVRLSSAAALAVVMRAAAAPSVICEELPAVMSLAVSGSQL